MSVLRPFQASDMFKFNNVSLQVSQYNIGFYLHYLSRWPDLCCVQEAPTGRMMGYVTGKAEGQGAEWHGHVTAITVAPEYRRLSLARKMMSLLDYVYRRVRNIMEFWDEEDAFDMRKPLSEDGARRSVRSNGRDIVVSAHDVS
ncbi:hypothetical protein BDP27DRAFT_1331608 [Rhodocollybia butyracea]|uniref:N-acetyltransferase domain-containing protein n=1 Tax=Rhodocollybia butyracea TaxID=206335 RepID=A0A9P5PLY9_9AGAR|nr:hypothetical protein BDP27DRAFT_1331608 [Rhodocollybia butyracea]